MCVIFMTVVLEFSRYYPGRQNTSRSLSQLNQRTRPVKTFSLHILAVCAAAFFAAAASAQQDFSKVEIQTEKLADTVYMMTGEGGNLGVSVGEDAVFVIDDQFAPLTPKSGPRSRCYPKSRRRRMRFITRRA